MANELYRCIVIEICNQINQIRILKYSFVLKPTKIKLKAYDESRLQTFKMTVLSGVFRGGL